MVNIPRDDLAARPRTQAAPWGATRWLALAACLLILTPSAEGAPRTRFKVLENGMSRATFKTEAPLETVVGNTSSVSGSVEFDRTRPHLASGFISVALATLHTGHADRDRNMHSADWLATGRFPHATFRLKTLRLAKDARRQAPIKGKAWGTLTIRGAPRDLGADLTVTYLPHTPEMGRMDPPISDDILKVEATFKTTFTHHGMQVPQIALLRLANEIEIQVTLVMVRQKTSI